MDYNLFFKVYTTVNGNEQVICCDPLYVIEKEFELDATELSKLGSMVPGDKCRMGIINFQCLAKSTEDYVKNMEANKRRFFKKVNECRDLKAKADGLRGEIVRLNHNLSVLSEVIYPLLKVIPIKGIEISGEDIIDSETGEVLSC